MPINERVLTMPGQWAKGAQTNIPNPPVPGVAYRNVNLSVADIENGQHYDKVYDSARYNQIDYCTTGLIQGLEQYGILPWSGLTNYPEHAFCLGMDGALYQALQASGPNSGGAQETSNKNYWKSALALESVNPLVYPSAFQTFYEQTPPKGWKVRNGAVLNDAEAQFPDLWAALKSPSNAWKVKTLAQWTALSTAAGGVGGVPFFVLDNAAKTIKLPDTRGDYERGAGSTYLSAVGAWHEDAIRNITGGPLTTLTPAYTNKPTPLWQSALGIVAGGSRTMAQDVSNGAYSFSLGFDASKDSNVLTAPENRTRAFAVLPCVYVGGV